MMRVPFLLLIIFANSLSGCHKGGPLAQCWGSRDSDSVVKEVNGVPVLFHKLDQDASAVIQCQQDGIQECWFVETNLRALKKLSLGDKILMLADSQETDKLDSKQKLKGDLTGKILKHYHFASGDRVLTATDRNGNINVGSVFRTLRRVYSVEKCDREDLMPDCHVMYYRKWTYYDDFCCGVGQQEESGSPWDSTN
eukprot:TRINITY_DN35884_c0_g3_i1.p1 TRINITY_DN35884_c0_g3~~TRINITY_DN35884_c0_g3_i1.p1  ORF type:complete len:196 (-),score=20.68 TRINITY_DN35884_c0_g3_i1:323-910(-)